MNCESNASGNVISCNEVTGLCVQPATADRQISLSFERVMSNGEACVLQCMGNHLECDEIVGTQKLMVKYSLQA